MKPFHYTWRMRKVRNTAAVDWSMTPAGMQGDRSQRTVIRERVWVLVCRVDSHSCCPLVCAGSLSLLIFVRPTTKAIRGELGAPRAPNPTCQPIRGAPVEHAKANTNLTPTALSHIHTCSLLFFLQFPPVFYALLGLNLTGLPSLSLSLSLWP